MRADTSPSPLRPLLISAGVVAAAIVAAVVWVSVARGDTGPAAAPAPDQPAAEDAPAESSGPPTGGLLPEETSMGAVDLAVQDVDAVAGYYSDAVGLNVLERSDEHAVLGFDDPLLRLELIDADLDDPREAGLYHSAILFPDEASLAAALASIAVTAPESYQGAADHAVSLAFYFGDPEGNGLELYVDRPRDEWVWQDGSVRMGSAALDPNAFMAEHLPEDAAELPADGVMGHVHLRVGDLAAAREFYEGVLGFDVTSETDGALFYSAGGYHHHLATNTWQSAGAGLRGDAAGLRSLSIVLPGQADVDEVRTRAEAAGTDVQESGDAVVVSDPWGNSIRLIVG